MSERSEEHDRRPTGPLVPATGGRLYLALELALFFVAVPIFLFVYRRLFAEYVIPSIVLVAAGCLIVLLLDPELDRRRLWNAAELWPRFRHTLLFFVPAAAALGVIFAVVEPERLFGLPLRSPTLWLLVMVLYPVVSVYPQELIFRTFIFHRYRFLFPNRWAMIVASGVIFGLAHLFFGSWIAPVLSAVGGVRFAYTYARTDSTLQASLEHGLWGDFLFTVGLGWYFYSGSIS